jgi:WhiB family transcriptional regulator, redox-sensing transcriptional regulator
VRHQLGADVLQLRRHEFATDPGRPPGRRRGRRPGVRLVALSGVVDLLAAAGDASLPCWSSDPDLFFAEAPADIDRAKAICQDCPVRRQCLVSALQRQEPWGVWGGEYLANGAIVTHKRARGRPRKEPIAA